MVQELDEIYIDASNTLNVAMEGHALLLLTKVMRPLLTRLGSALLVRYSVFVS